MPDLREAVLSNPAIWNGYGLFQFALNPDTTSLLISQTVEETIFPILNIFLKIAYKFPKVKPLTLQHDYASVPDGDISHVPVDELFRHVRNNRNALGKIIEYLTPEVIDDMFIGHSMRNNGRCYLYDVIKQPLVEFTEGHFRGILTG